MAIMEKIKHELKNILLLTLYFAVWIGFMVLFKRLVLAQYAIAYKGLSIALVGALILSKVVLVMERVSLGAWVRRQPVIVDVLLRTLLYTLGVAIVLILEKSFEGRHEHGSISGSLAALFHDLSIHHIMANVICVSGSLLVYTAMDAVSKHLGAGGLRNVFFSPRNSTE